MELVQFINGFMLLDLCCLIYKENVYSFQYGLLKVIVFNNNYWICKKVEKFGGALEGYFLVDQLVWFKSEIVKVEVDPMVQYIVFFVQELLFFNSGYIKDGMWYYGNNVLCAYIVDVKIGQLVLDGFGILEV